MAKDAPPPGWDDINEPVSSPMAHSAGGVSADVPPPGWNEEIADEIREEKYGGVGQQLKTAAEGAASAATFGLSTGLETHLGIAKPEDILARREVNPVSYGVGQVAGLAAPALLTGGTNLGMAAAMEGTGLAAANLATKVVGSGVGGRIASQVVKGIAEGILMQSGDEVSKYLVSDPTQTAQTVAANIGLSGLIGGGISGSLGAVSPLWSAMRGNKTAATLTNFGNEAAASAEAGAAGDLAREMKTGPNINIPQPGEGPYGDHIRDSLFQTKPNALEIQEAGARHGLALGSDALNDSKMAQALRDSLSKEPTIGGSIYGKKIQQIYDTTKDLSEYVLKDSSKLTKYQAGEELKAGLINKLKSEGESIQAGYEKLTPTLKAIPVDKELKAEAAQAIMSNEMVAVAPELESLANKTIKQIQSIETVDGLRKVRTYINGEIDKALPKIGAADTNRASILLTAKEELNKIRAAAIEGAETGTLLGEEKATSKLVDLKELDSQWAAHKKKLLELGNQAGLGKPSSTRTLINKLETLPSEALTNKLLDAQDVNALRYIKENFPEQFEIARKYKLKEIKEAAQSAAKGRNSELDVGSFLRQVDDSKIGPEAKELIFSGKDHAQTIKDIDLLYTGALPENFNPSGTAAAFSFSKLFSPEGLVQNGTSLVKLAILNGTNFLNEAAGIGSKQATEIAAGMVLRSGAQVSPTGFKALVDYVQHTLRGETAVSKGIKSVFDSGKMVLPTKIPDKDTREKLSKKLEELAVNSAPLFNVGGDTAHYAPDHGTAIAETASNAVSYLNSLRPVVRRENPLDTELKPDPFKKAQFDRALDIAEQPLIVLSGIKKGRVDPMDMVHIKALYPAVYQKLSNKMNEQMIEAVHAKKVIPYRTRLGISSFLGQPLDSTMTASFIQAAQPQNQTQHVPESQQQGGGGKQGPRNYKALAKLSNGVATPAQSRELTRSTVRS